MKPTLTLHNDWRYAHGKYGDVNLLELHFDWYRGASYYFTFRLFGFGFTVGAWDDTEHNTALAEIESWRTVPLVDDPEAHAVVSGFPSGGGVPIAPSDSWQVYEDQWPGESHVGAQSFTVTIERLNPVNQRDEE